METTYFVALSTSRIRIGHCTTNTIAMPVTDFFVNPAQGELPRIFLQLAWN
jgi:hypothetical protein